MTRTLWALTAAVGFLVAAGLGVDAEQTPSCTVFVQPGQSIQAVINDVPEGAVICLADGGWVERLTIEKSLTLRGGSTTTICSGEPDRILISVRRPVGSDRVSVVLDGLRLIGFLGEPALGARGAATITVGGGAEVVIANCAISGSGFGVNLWNSSTVAMTDCTITGNQVGVLVEGWAKATISGCTVSKNRDTGIQVYGATVEVAGCTLAENEYGVRSSSSGGVTLADSMISDNQFAVLLDGSAVATVTQCTVYHNGNGIWLTDSAQALIQTCSISRSGTAISIESTGLAIIDGCSIFANSTGIELQGAAIALVRDNVIQTNMLVGVETRDEECLSEQLSEFLGHPSFTGRVTGGGNTIPDWNEPHGNGGGSICPGALAFLMTKEGGELDRRPAP